MKLVIFIALTLACSASQILPLGIGAECDSNGVVFINAFYVNPYPPTSCAAQAVSMTGTFSMSYCPGDINIHESYNQVFFADDSIVLDQCYSENQQYTFNFNYTTSKCTAGTYDIQVAIRSKDQSATLSCWEYSYTLN